MDNIIKTLKKLNKKVNKEVGRFVFLNNKEFEVLENYYLSKSFPDETTIFVTDTIYDIFKSIERINTKNGAGNYQINNYSITIRKVNKYKTRSISIYHNNKLIHKQEIYGYHIDYAIKYIILKTIIENEKHVI